MIDETLAATYDRMYAQKRHLVRPHIMNFLPQGFSPELGRVLDIGGGEGHFSIEFGLEGFQVEFVDISSVAVAQVMWSAQEHEISIEARRADIIEEGIAQDYAVIICTFVLHHMLYDQGFRLIEQIKERTKPGGVNIMTAHTRNGDMFLSGLVDGNYYPEPWEFQTLYSDWNIILYNEQIAPSGTFDDDSPMHDQNAYLLAQKPATS